MVLFAKGTGEEFSIFEQGIARRGSRVNEARRHAIEFRMPADGIVEKTAHSAVSTAVLVQKVDEAFFSTFAIVVHGLI